MSCFAVGWSRLALAGALAVVWIAAVPIAVAQESPPAGSDIPAKKQELEGMLQTRAQGNDESASVQKKIDEISDQTDELLGKYRTTLKQIDSIRIYNSQMRELITSQEEELESLQGQLDQIEVVGRSVMPLMLKMIDAYESLVELDLPFLLDERRERVAELRKLMKRADVTSAEKYRRIMEAYQIENEYGRTIEAYRSTLDLAGREATVDFLRFGRIALVYQTPDGTEAGVWNHDTKSWEPLDPRWRGAIKDGLRIARKQAAPDLIRLPLPAAVDGGAS
jgi:septal ring factor EnvC (AmiA/AmiB activator)